MEADMDQLNKDYQELVVEGRDCPELIIKVGDQDMELGEFNPSMPLIPDIEFDPLHPSLGDEGSLPELGIFHLRDDCANVPNGPIKGALMYKGHNIIDPRRVQLALAYARGIRQVPTYVITGDEALIDLEWGNLQGPAPTSGMAPTGGCPTEGRSAEGSPAEGRPAEGRPVRVRRRIEAPPPPPPPAPPVEGLVEARLVRVKETSKQRRLRRARSMKAREEVASPLDTRLIHKVRVLEAKLKAEQALVNREKAVTRQAYDDVNRLTRDLGRARADLARAQEDLKTLRAEKDELARKLKGTEFSGGKMLSAGENSVSNFSGQNRATPGPNRATPGPNRAAPAALGRPGPNWAQGPFL